MFPTEITSGVTSRVRVTHHARNEFCTEEEAPKKAQGSCSKGGEQLFVPE